MKDFKVIEDFSKFINDRLTELYAVRELTEDAIENRLGALLPPFGTPNDGICYGQDGNFPFQYDPANDVYVGYRWDTTNDKNSPNGEIGPIITPEILQARECIWLTTKPNHYDSPWMNNRARLSTVYFKLPRWEQIHSYQLGKNNLFKYHLKEGADYVERYEPLPPAAAMLRAGINGFVFNDFRNPPELCLWQPSAFVVGLSYIEFNDMDRKTAGYNNKQFLDAQTYVPNFNPNV